MPAHHPGIVIDEIPVSIRAHRGGQIIETIGKRYAEADLLPQVLDNLLYGPGEPSGGERRQAIAAACVVRPSAGFTRCTLTSWGVKISVIIDEQQQGLDQAGDAFKPDNLRPLAPIQGIEHFSHAPGSKWR
jgi:hypothetical protein